MFKLTLAPSRRARIPRMAFGTGAGGFVPLPRRPGDTSLGTHSYFPGLLVKKVFSLDQLLHECQGIIYRSNDGFTNRTYFLHGKTFQKALNDMFPIFTENGNGFSTTNSTSTSAPVAQMKAALHDATVTAEYGPLGYTDTCFLRDSSDTDINQSSANLVDVYGVISYAEDGFGVNANPYRFSGEDHYSYYVKTDLDFMTIGQYLAKNAATIADAYDEGSKYVLAAIGEYVKTGVHRNVMLSVPLCTVVKAIGHASTRTHVGLPRFHARLTTFAYPTRNYPWFAPDCAVIPVAGDVGSPIENVVRGHLMGKAFIASGDDTFAPHPVIGHPIGEAISKAYNVLRNIPEALFSPGASDQQAKYDVNGMLTSIGSSGALVGPVDWLALAIDGPMGPGGYIQLMAAMREIQAKAESDV